MRYILGGGNYYIAIFPPICQGGKKIYYIAIFPPIQVRGKNGCGENCSITPVPDLGPADCLTPDFIVCTVTERNYFIANLIRKERLRYTYPVC